MTTYKVSKISRALLSKGFRQYNADHVYFIFYYEGKRTSVRTKISHGKDEYDDRLLNYMSIELHLEKKEFEEFIECPLTQEQYIELLKKRGVLPP